MNVRVVAGAIGLGVGWTAAIADEVRARLVNPRGTAEYVLLPHSDYARAAPNGRARVRLQLGVFDHEKDPALAGGVIGWNLGSITVDGQFITPMDVIRTPGRLSPFRTEPSSTGANGVPSIDPFTAITGIHNTLGQQLVPWPAGSDPSSPPPPVIRGLNTFVSVYEVTLILPELSFHEMRRLTIIGNFIAASTWSIITAKEPTKDEAGFVVYAPFAATPIAFGIEQGIVVERLWFCLADTDGNGWLDSQDFFAFLQEFFGSDPLADTNADGVITSQDFFDFLEAFFAGCI